MIAAFLPLIGTLVDKLFPDPQAAAAARLLIYSLPGKLPTTSTDGWAQYLDAWRPGKPHAATWAAHWATATIATGAKI